MNTLRQLLGREHADVKRRDLPRTVIEHDSIDQLRYDMLVEDSESFRDNAEDAPLIVPGVKRPGPIDLVSASPEEAEAHQARVDEYHEAERNSTPYGSWDPLHRDLYYSYHTRGDVQVREEVDAGVEFHKGLMTKTVRTDEHAEAREMTQGDDICSAWAVFKHVEKLKELLGDDLEQHMREAQELEERREEIEETTVRIEEILPPAPPTPEGEEEPEGEGEEPTGPPTDGTATIAPGGEGDPGPQPKVELSEKAKKELAELESRLGDLVAEADALAEPKPMDAEAIDALHEAAKAGEEGAEQAAMIPRFGAGLGGTDEPFYTSPEQAFECARQWCEDPELIEMCELVGRMSKDVRFKRSKRVENVPEEIVDVTVGDDLANVLPSELALLSHPSTRTDFLSRYLAGELLTYTKEGDENAGRGPIMMVLDGSGSMNGERNVYARAVALTMLQIARIEKRDFALVEFSSGVTEWLFKSGDPLPGDKVLEMATHMFGQGTVPILGMQRAAALMREAKEFKKADIVIVGDGDGGFGPEDEKLRDDLKAMGVRFFGIGIGGSFAYINEYCDFVVDVHDFQLNDATGQATSELAVRMT